jgi:putative addiction module component (TIGR02574 family)
MTVQEHIDVILKMTSVNKIEVFQKLWENLALENESKISNYEKQILDSRIDAYEARESEPIEWKKAKEKLNRKKFIN